MNDRARMITALGQAADLLEDDVRLLSHLRQPATQEALRLAIRHFEDDSGYNPTHTRPYRERRKAHADALRGLIVEDS